MHLNQIYFKIVRKYAYKLNMFGKLYIYKAQYKRTEFPVSMCILNNKLKFHYIFEII